MNRSNTTLKTYVTYLFLAALVVAGCNSPAGPMGGGSQLNGMTSQQGVREGDIITTTYKVVVIPPTFADLRGLYSPTPCWTVSPSPLPKYVATTKVYVSYTTGCSTRTLVITYESGYGSSRQPCDYKVHYPTGGPFNWTTMSEGEVTCAVATTPPSDNYDEQLIYGPVTALLRDSRTHRR
jgi:hypothetical protein